jgi:hypothetical protein
MMRHPTHLTLAVALACAAWAPRSAHAQAAPSCVVTTGSHTENFSSTQFKDPHSTIAGWGSGTLQLTYKAGALVTSSSTANLAERVYAVVPGDFKNSGANDLIGISDIGGTCHLDYFNNDGTGLFTLAAKVGSCTTTVGAVLTAGDVNNDGLKDFVLATVSNMAQAGTLSTAQLFVNTGVVAGKPTFNTFDIMPQLTTASVSWHIRGNQVVLFDWDGDHRDDLLILSSSDTTSQVLLYLANPSGSGPGFVGPPTVLLPNTFIATPIASASQTATGGYSCTPALAVSRGGTVLAPADYNADGLPDLVVASVSDANFKLFLQQSDGTLVRSADILFAPGGAVYGAARDMDENGTTDLVVMRSGNDCGGPPSQAMVLFNGGQADLSVYGNTLRFPGTAGFAAFFDIDNDPSHTVDIFGGRITGIGRAVTYKNTASTAAYSLKGEALSKNLVSLDPQAVGIVSVTVQSFAANVPASCSLSVWVTNTGGSSWEQLSATELSGAQHIFSSFGTDLRYKIKFSAPAASLSGSQAAYAPAALNSPKVTQLAFNYDVVGTQQYSRSGLANAQFSVSGTPVELLYSASFLYPGFVASLYAYDISNLTAGGAAANSLQRVDNASSVSLRWEAGTSLVSVAGPSRTLYTAYPLSLTANPTTAKVSRLNFSDSEIVTGSSSPSLATLMTVNALSSAQRTNLLDFLDGGMGDPNNHKMFDTGHSSPVFVGPPQGDANYYQNNYAGFVLAQAGRTPVVLLGTNDGVLHTFDALTGKELWGYIPYNLLTKMKQQRGMDPNGKVQYQHAAFVDGSISVQDIYSGGAWHTVAIVGQAQGTGLAGNNYYFALDITTPQTPQPLWEFSDRLNSSGRACSLSDNCVNNCTPTCTQDPNSCTLQCSAFDSYLLVDPLKGGVGTAGGLIEAEHFDNEQSAPPPPAAAAYDWNIFTAPLNGSSAGNVSSGGYVQATASPAASCPSGPPTTASVSNCTQLSYRTYISTSKKFNVYVRLLVTGPGDQSIHLGLDDAYVATFDAGTASTGDWTWYQVFSRLDISQGDHVINIWMKQSGVRFDAIFLTHLNKPPVPGLMETCGSTCNESCTSACTQTCYSSPSTVEWPQCGVGAGLQCCGAVGGDQYCAPVGPTCGGVPSVMGQTWSAPALGRVTTTAGEKWVAFFGSGYNNRFGAPNVGRALYAVDALSGQIMGQWNVGDLPTGPNNPSTIDNSVPGAPSLIDVNNDGFVDRVYFGDLEGRLWKLETSANVALNASGAMNPNAYLLCTLFDAGDPNQTGSRTWAPIVTKPALASLAPNTTNVYFGCGGDDRAPDTLSYAFYSVRDTDPPGVCRAQPIKALNLSLSNNMEWSVVSDSPGYRFWADPVINNGTSVFFVGLPGKIESVDPCIDIQGQSKVYQYALANYRDATGRSIPAGTSVFGTAPNQRYLASTSKIRKAALLRSTAATPVPHGVVNPVTQVKSDVFLQNFAGSSPGDRPAIQRLTDPGTLVESRLRILRWREISL